MCRKGMRTKEAVKIKCASNYSSSVEQVVVDSGHPRVQALGCTNIIYRFYSADVKQLNVFKNKFKSKMLKNCRIFQIKKNSLSAVSLPPDLRKVYSQIP